jgi:hypothetical protein
LKKTGFKFKECKNRRSFLIEINDIVAQRATYLRRMKKKDELGSNKKLVYLDETWIHPTYTGGKCWQDSKTEGVMKNDSAYQQWIIVHAGSERGFVPEAYLILKSKTKSRDYHDEMNFENFSKWIKEMLLPNLPPNCLTVLDNVPYHSVQMSKPPTLLSKKKKQFRSGLRKGRCRVNDGKETKMKHFLTQLAPVVIQ